MNIKHISQEWWRRTKGDTAALEGWLRKQHRGEATAASRIEALRDKYALDRESRAWRILSVIASQERKHASWVGQLLHRRGVQIETSHAEERYWREPLAQIRSLETGCAVGAHAEAMRLARIEAICDDTDAPSDIRDVFSRIIVEERFHERAFRKLAGPAAMQEMAGAHHLGASALGLAP